jgi:hypothetical protein
VIIAWWMALGQQNFFASEPRQSETAFQPCRNWQLTAWTSCLLIPEKEIAAPRLLILLTAFSPLAAAQGGPPFITNDPGTAGDRNWEDNIVTPSAIPPSVSSAPRFLT